MHRVAALAAVIAAASACSVPFTTPQRPLAPGEKVVQASADLPGFSLLPRASASYTQGLGGGDLGVHAGTSLVTSHLGLHGRLYLAPAVVSLQTSVISSLGPFQDLFDDRRLGFFTSTLRLGNFPRPDGERLPDWLYGGFELGGIVPFRDRDGGDFEIGRAYALALPGLYGGLEYQLRDRVVVQSEFSVRFLALGADDDGRFAAPTFWPQLGANLQFAF